MRVGLVTDFYYPWIGGPSTLIRNLGEGLAGRGHAVSLLAPSPDGRHRVESDGCMRVTRVRTVPAPVGYRLRVAAWPWTDVAAWLDAERPEVVHIHHPFPVSAAAARAARRRRVPVVATNHTIPACSLWGIRGLGPIYRVAYEALAWWLVHLMRECRAVATPTRTAADELRRLGFEGQIEAISNGVDTTRFAPGSASDELRARLGLDERLVVLYTGRLDAEKQMDVWLQAAARAASEHDVQFLVGGEGSDRARLERLAAELRIRNRVRFFGYLDRRVYHEVYRLADVFLITSPVELQSISTLEAIASGVPAIGVRAGALAELIHEGENGYLAAPGDWREVGNRLSELLGDTALRRHMGERSRQIALTHEMSRTVEAYEKLFERAAG